MQIKKGGIGKGYWKGVGGFENWTRNEKRGMFKGNGNGNRECKCDLGNSQLGMEGEKTEWLEIANGKMKGNHGGHLQMGNWN